jgi:hypothetical protein
LGLGGAGCAGSPYYKSPPAPAVPPTPTLQQIIQVVNANSLRIESLSTSDATLNGPGFPALRANVAFERPRRFRLRAETAIAGPELDLGSNDELFWFWVRRSFPPALFYCRYGQFETSPVRHALPIRPEWLIEALGINEFDPNLPHQGPIPLSDGRYEVRTVRETSDGPTTKVTVVDGMRGLVVEQHVYDAQGRLVASSVISRHRRDPLSGLYVPQVVDIHSASAQFSMRLDLGTVHVNRLEGDPALLWSMPVYEGFPAVDLCDPNRQPLPGAAVAPMTSQRAAPPRARNRLLR